MPSSAPLACPAARVRDPGLIQGPGLVKGIECPHPAVHGFRPGAESPDQLDGGDLLRFKQRGEFRGGFENEIGGHAGRIQELGAGI
jgi:hypothetical protein